MYQYDEVKCHCSTLTQFNMERHGDNKRQLQSAPRWSFSMALHIFHTSLSQNEKQQHNTHTTPHSFPSAKTVPPIISTHPETPLNRCSSGGIPGMRAYLNGPLEGLLNIQPLAHDGLIQLPFKRQQIHVSLRLWDQLPDLGHGNERDKAQSYKSFMTNGDWETARAQCVANVKIMATLRQRKWRVGGIRWNGITWK